MNILAEVAAKIGGIFSRNSRGKIFQENTSICQNLDANPNEAVKIFNEASWLSLELISIAFKNYS